MGIGETLRAERLRQKRSIDDIYRKTRIPAHFLEAIEDEGFDRLPGLLFTRNFVRQYAEALNLDSDALISELPRIDISTAPLPNPPRGLRMAPAWDARWTAALSSAVWLVIAIGAASAAYVHFSRPLEMSSAANSVKAGEGVPRTVPFVRGRDTRNAAGRPVDAARAPVETASLKSAATPAAAAKTTGAEQGNHKVNVSITAHQDAWIQLSADGKKIFTGTLKPNDSKEVSADEAVNLIAGNAGGITLSLNGKPLDPLGASGQVKVLTLTEEGPEVVRRVPAPPDPL